MHTLRVLTVAVVLAAVVLSGCGGSVPATGRLPIVASFYPLAEFARRIGGDRAAVHTLVPPGVEAHDYEQGLRGCRRKEFVTANAAFGYLAARRSYTRRHWSARHGPRRWPGKPVRGLNCSIRSRG